MPPLISRILLTILMFPFAALIYLGAYGVFDLQLLGRSPGRSLIASGIVAWVFIVIYWFAVWRRVVQPATLTRIAQMLAAVLFAIAGAVAAGWLVDSITNNSVIVALIASAAAPLLWLTAVVFFWRESPAERDVRLRNANAAIFCPVCGYNLTGLNATRCPECGRQFTIDELLAKQANRARELDSAR
jgi:hypothetical protein